MKNLKLLYAVMIAFLFSGIILGQTSTSFNNVDSKLWLEGTSTFHDFTINAKEFNSKLVLKNSMGSDGSVQGYEISELKFSVPVKGLDSDKESMNENMQDAMNMEEYPNITFELTFPVQFNLKNNLDSVKVNAAGNLTIAGVKKPVFMNIEVIKKADNKFEFKGSQKLLMTSYNVDPPTMFFGTMKTGDEITVMFNLFLSRN